jgi:hypothetical protein
MLAVYGDERDEIPASALAVAFEFVAAELRLVDAADYIAYIHQEKFANIHDIVSSSVELFFNRERLHPAGAQSTSSIGTVHRSLSSTWSFVTGFQACVGRAADQCDGRLSVAW